MIDATQITRAAQDSFRWCQRHPWLVLSAVVVLLVGRSWLRGESPPPQLAATDSEWLDRKPLPKDYLLTKTDALWPDAYRECHRQLMGEMAKFEDWELLWVRTAFTTETPRGRAFVIGLVMKTKHASGNGKWIVWDQTWFFRDGKLIADFDTSEFGKQGAIAWCFQQEEIQRVYGYDTRTPFDAAQQ